MKKYEIYVGLKDQDTLNELFSPDDFAHIMSGLCREDKIGFSLTTQLGGYAHNKGYVTETSLRVTLVGVSREETDAIAGALKELINTDTVMITSEECEYEFR